MAVAIIIHPLPHSIEEETAQRFNHLPRVTKLISRSTLTWIQVFWEMDLHDPTNFTSSYPVLNNVLYLTLTSLQESCQNVCFSAGRHLGCSAHSCYQCLHWEGLACLLMAFPLQQLGARLQQEHMHAKE